MIYQLKTENWFVVNLSKTELLGIVISCVGCDEMADPAEKASGPDPKTGRDDQPEDPAPDRAIIDLTYARDD
jgi:hypothetical protein